MTIPRLPMCGLLLGAVALWTPSANGFSPEDFNVAARPAPTPNIPPLPGKSPSDGSAQTATPWTDAQCRTRMEQLFKMAGDPSVDINEVWGDIGGRAGSSFAIYCRIKEAKSIKILEHELKNIEANRQETVSSDTRMDKAGKKMEKVHDTNSTYDPFGFPTRN